MCAQIAAFIQWSMSWKFIVSEPQAAERNNAEGMDGIVSSLHQEYQFSRMLQWLLGNPPVRLSMLQVTAIRWSQDAYKGSVRETDAQNLELMVSEANDWTCIEWPYEKSCAHGHAVFPAQNQCDQEHCQQRVSRTRLDPTEGAWTL